MEISFKNGFDVLVFGFKDMKQIKKYTKKYHIKQYKISNNWL